MFSLIGEVGGLFRVMAYIDPNSGGLIFQALAVMFGLFSGMILFFSGRIRLFLGKLRRGRRGENALDAEDDDQESLAGTEDDEL